MAIYGIIGDIHGNLEALQATLADLERREVQTLLCIGDVIGYNANSNECVELVRSRDIPTIAGNHDLIGIGRLNFDRCSNKARYSLQRTRRTLSAESRQWLGELPGSLLIDGCLALVHGGVRDVQLYMTSAQHIQRNLPLLATDFPSARVCFFGHCHEQAVYEVCGDDVREKPGPRVALSRDRIYFVNPGSVDAQRKRGYELAQFALFDSDRWAVEFVAVPYDTRLTESNATTEGYRIGPLEDRWYNARRRVRNGVRRLASRLRRSERPL